MIKAISMFMSFLTYAISAYFLIASAGDICNYFGINGGEYIAISILLGVLALRTDINGDKDIDGDKDSKVD